MLLSGTENQTNKNPGNCSLMLGQTRTETRIQKSGAARGRQNQPVSTIPNSEVSECSSIQGGAGGMTVPHSFTPSWENGVGKEV